MTLSYVAHWIINMMNEMFSYDVNKFMINSYYSYQFYEISKLNKQILHCLKITNDDAILIKERDYEIIKVKDRYLYLYYIKYDNCYRYRIVMENNINYLIGYINDKTELDLYSDYI